MSTPPPEKRRKLDPLTLSAEEDQDEEIELPKGREGLLNDDEEGGDSDSSSYEDFDEPDGDEDEDHDPDMDQSDEEITDNDDVESTDSHIIQAGKRASLFRQNGGSSSGDMDVDQKSDSPAGTSQPKKKQSSKSTGSTPTSKKKSRSAQSFVRVSFADAYFQAQARPALTSSHVFSQLLPPLTTAAYNNLLAESKSASKHEKELEDLHARHVARFLTWAIEMEEANFNIICYGFGSKRAILNQFAMDELVNRGDVVVVNGLFPGLGIRELLMTIAEQIPQNIYKKISNHLAASKTFSNSTEALATAIITYYQQQPSTTSSDSTTTLSFTTSEVPLFLVLHSIDAPSLRTPSSKSILSILASSPRVHIVSSVDHIDSSTLFSVEETSSNFNWVWHDVTTLQPYTYEVSFTRSAAKLPNGGILGGDGSFTATEAGARHILISVPVNAKKLFIYMCQQQIAAIEALGIDTTQPNPPSYSLDKHTFFKDCKAKFIARDEIRFNTLMVEFKDHRLILEEGGSLWVPLEKEAMERLMEEFKHVEEDS